MRPQVRNAITLTILLAAMIAISIFAGGCSTLRFAPSESQKQIALDTYQTAQTVNASGAAAQSPATQKLVSGTAATIAYTGYPANPTITDYPTTLQTAQTDAAKRPTIDDVAKTFDGWMELGIGIAGLFGGGVGLKIAAALKSTKDKAVALKEVVQGNEEFKRWLEANGGAGTIDAFRTAQTGVQSVKTEQAVFEIRSSLPQTVTSINAKPTATPAINQA
jgi:hypothetical protein